MTVSPMASWTAESHSRGAGGGAGGRASSGSGAGSGGGGVVGTRSLVGVQRPQATGQAWAADFWAPSSRAQKWAVMAARQQRSAISTRPAAGPATARPHLRTPSAPPSAPP